MPSDAMFDLHPYVTEKGIVSTRYISVSPLDPPLHSIIRGRFRISQRMGRRPAEEGTNIQFCQKFLSNGSSGSRGRLGGGGKKHEIYAAKFDGHLFYDLAPSASPGSATEWGATNWIRQ